MKKNLLPFDLATGDVYENARGSALWQLQVCGQSLFDAAVDLTFKGPWRERSEAAPVGEVVSLNSDEMRATGNKDIVAILDAYDALYAAHLVLSGLKREGG